MKAVNDNVVEQEIKKIVQENVIIPESVIVNYEGAWSDTMSQYGFYAKIALMAILLVFVLMLSLTACGSSEKNSDSGSSVAAAQPASEDVTKGSKEQPSSSQPAPTDPEVSQPTDSQPAASQPAASVNPEDEEVVAWDSKEKLTVDYEDRIALLDTTNVHVTARKLEYEDHEGEMWLSLSVTVQNLTGKDMTVNTTVEAHTYTSEVKAGKSKKVLVGSYIKDWNCLLGHTEECLQGSCRMDFISGNEIVDAVSFDWYSSKINPFGGVVQGVDAITEAAKKADRSKAEAWDPDEQLHYVYPNLLLMENSHFRIVVKALHYDKNESLEAGHQRVIVLQLVVQNKTGSDLSVYVNGKTGNYDHLIPAKGEKTVQLGSYEWNCLIGGSEECNQHHWKLLVRTKADDNNGPVLGNVEFDWYASKTEPCRNIQIK